MGDNKNKNYLTYGCTISLCLPSEQNRFMYNQGFIKTKSQLKEFTIQTPYLQYSHCLFEIYPQFLDSSKQAAMQLIDQLKDNTDESARKRTNQIDDAKQKVFSEFKFNQETFKKLVYQPIKFDTPVQLLHVQSQKFLCSSDDFLQKEFNLKLSLSEQSSQFTNFKFLPGYIFLKRTSGIIHLTDTVLVCSTQYFQNQVPYLYFQGNKNEIQYESEYRNILQIQNEGKIQQPNTSQLLENQSKKQNSEIILSVDLKSLWKINLFTDYLSNNDYFKYGDMIWFIHTDKDLIILVSKKQKHNDLNQEYLNDDDDYLDCYKMGQNQQQVDSNSFWIIEHVDYRVGGFLQINSQFRLKHFSSGKYLSIQYEQNLQDSKKVQIPLASLQDHPDINTLFSFERLKTTIVKNNMSKVPKEMFYKIQHSQSQLYLNIQTIKNEQTKISYNIIEFQKYAGDEASFKIICTSVSEKEESSFLLSSKPLILKTIQLTKQQFVDKKLIIKYRRFYRFLDEISKFTLNKIIIVSTDLQYGYPNPRRQKALKEQYILQNLIVILTNLIAEEDLQYYHTKQLEQQTVQSTSIIQQFHNKQEQSSLNLDEKSQADYNFINLKVNSINKIYELLIDICSGNRDNEEYLFNLFPQLLFHTKYLPLSINTLISIVQNNESIAHNLCEQFKDLKKKNPGIKSDDKYSALNNKKNVILFFLDQIGKQNIKNRNPNFLKFISNICKVNNQGQSINQELIYNVLENPDYAYIKDQIFFPTKIIKPQYDMHIEFERKRISKLSDFFQETKDFTKKQNCLYFIELLRMFTNLAFGRNFLWTKKLSIIFPIDFVIHQIQNVNLEQQIRSAFIHLCISLYVDQEPLNYQKIPQKLRIFVSRQNKKLRLNPKKERQKDLTSTDKFIYNEIIEKTSEYLNKEENEFKIMKHRESRNARVLDLHNFKFNFKIEEKQQDESINQIQMIKQVQQQQKTQQSKQTVIQQVNLTYDFLKLGTMMIKFNILDLLNQTNQYSNLFPQYIGIFEKDLLNKNYQAALQQFRDEKIERLIAKNDQESNKLYFTIHLVITQVIMIIKEVLHTIHEITKSLAGGLFGQSSKVQINEKLTEFIDFDEVSHYQSSITRPFISIKNELEQLEAAVNVQISPQSLQFQQQIKLQVCEFIDYMNKLRLDFILENFLQWFELFQYQINSSKQIISNKHELLSLFQEEISKNAITVIPPLLMTGIREIDEVYDESLKEISLQNMSSIVNVLQSKKFKNYTEDQEISDMDQLFGKDLLKDYSEDGKINTLPTLLLIFISTKSRTLEEKIIKLLLDVFGQRELLRTHLLNMDLIYEQQEITIYQQIQQVTKNLSQICARSEIWLKEFVESEDEDDDTNVVRIILNNLLDFQNAFYKKMNIQNERIIKSPDDNEILETRQKIVENLNGQIIIFKFIKDIQQQISMLINEQKVDQKSNYFQDIMQIKIIKHIKFYKQIND